jgi:hypothetical protein
VDCQSRRQAGCRTGKARERMRKKKAEAEAKKKAEAARQDVK